LNKAILITLPTYFLFMSLLSACAVGDNLASQLNANAVVVKKLPIDDQCASQIDANPDFNVIRGKVELTRRLSDGPPPSIVTSDTSVPSEQEANAIREWLVVRQVCDANLMSFLNWPTPTNSSPLTTLQQDSYFGVKAYLAILDLTGALSFRRITYGDYAERSYEIARDALAAERLFRRSVIAKEYSGQRQALALLERDITSWEQGINRDLHSQSTGR
jgi:hypothetical protein